MGIMSEIERAWITLDHKLFLWDYVEGYAYYLLGEIERFIDEFVQAGAQLVH